MSDLLIKPSADSKNYHSLTSEQAGWTYLNFEAKVLDLNEQIVRHTGEYEYCIVLLGGNFKVEAGGEMWETGNGRKDVFSGIGHAMYLSRNTDFTLTAQSPGTDIAICWVASDEDHPPRMKRPEEAAIEYRGGDNANRQINSLLEPGFPCHKIVCV
jgi:5-deoxy-glucuronate isomerase